jgi:hypothetical protein
MRRRRTGGRCSNRSWRLSAAERRQIVTLPPAIAKLTAVRHLVLYGTNLARIPPEIGAMTSLKVFEPYTSHRLHWYPYELTRCVRLADSTVSTRVLYGNFKFRPPFPALRPVTDAGEADFAALDPGVWGADAVRTCSVCDGPVDRELRQVWISRRVGTDVLPLLVNACSATCVAALPEPHRGYVPTPHTGGPDLYAGARAPFAASCLPRFVPMTRPKVFDRRTDVAGGYS